MPLTGRFGFRKSIFGKIVLQVEEERPAPFSVSGRLQCRWRDARIMDLVRPEIRGLINLRDYAQECPHGNFAATLFAHGRPTRETRERIPEAKPVSAMGQRPERHDATTLHGTVL